MSQEPNTKARRCCSREHDRLVDKLDTCDQLYKNPLERHRCARVIARRSGQRAKHCILQE